MGDATPSPRTLSVFLYTTFLNLRHILKIIKKKQQEQLTGTVLLATQGGRSRVVTVALQPSCSEAPDSQSEDTQLRGPHQLIHCTRKSQNHPTPPTPESSASDNSAPVPPSEPGWSPSGYVHRCRPPTPGPTPPTPWSECSPPSQSCSLCRRPRMGGSIAPMVPSAHSISVSTVLLPRPVSRPVSRGHWLTKADSRWCCCCQMVV